MSEPMTDHVIDPDTGQPLPRSRSRSRIEALRAPALMVVAILAGYAAVAVVAGWLWHQLWSPDLGVVVSHQWYATGDALRDAFSGTGLYVLVALGAGLLIGFVSAYAGGAQPVVTVVVATLGSALAAYVMLKVGEGLGPADPQQLAATVADGKNLPSALRVSGFSPLLAFPFGTLVALAVVYTIFPGKSPEAGFGAEPRG
ncbi:MAG: hypothetical protein ABIO16_16250 [Nocardioides sp.]